MNLGTRTAALGRRGGVDPDVADQLGFTVHDVVRDLRRDVAAAALPLPIEGSEEAEASRRRLLAQLDEHLLPRLAELSSPAMVVVAGSTGAGKSTLFNSMLGEEVSDAGVLRPTTREPVLAVHPHDAEVLKPGPVTDLARVVHHTKVPRGTALLDAPDLDSFLSANRTTAHQLLEAADLWLFVTTAARYGDALPWQALGRAKERGASVAMVLNRVPRETLTTVRGDLSARLREHGMTDVPLFVVPDVGPHEGMLEPALVAPVLRWLTLLAGPDRSRTVILRTLKGALGALPDWVTSLADAVEDQGDAARRLRHTVDMVVPDAAASARRTVTAGTAGGTSIAARWSELVGTAALERVAVKDGVARSTRRAGRVREQALAGLRTEVEAAAQRALVAASARAEERLVAALAGPGAPAGGASVLPPGRERGARRDVWAESSVGEWARLADDVAAGLGTPPAAARASAAEGDPASEGDRDDVVHQVPDLSEAPRAEGARKAFGPSGLAALLLAAAVGNSDAERLLDRVLGDTASEAVAVLRDDLAERAAAAVAEEARSVQSALEVPALADDAAAPLRVRLAELRRLT
ncbi:GTPase [Antribacter gilvus]|uniref:GTPase n=1 Tax=Antribacter gilvus TaxID=2304675 RepID=UPI001F0CAA04|nr:GTPase domain-containing protein [Antribacter gilvus]